MLVMVLDGRKKNAAMRTDDPDYFLVQGMAQGNAQALEDLYQKHGLRLLNYLIGQVGDAALAEEILQNVMLAAWKAAPTFRGESKVRTWLMAIAHNQAINARRGRRFTSVPLNEEERDEKTGPFEAILRQAWQAEVRTALLQLPDEQRETLELVFYHGLSGAEAAEILGVSEGTIKSRLHRAKATLKQLLTKEGHNG
jgi:RNA polymerase sigma-70 factor (ECF subfamily)